MAAGDYFRCSRCGRKAFYDAHLNYGNDLESLDYCGQIAALCLECAKTHRLIIVERTEHPEVGLVFHAKEGR